MPEIPGATPLAHSIFRYFEEANREKARIFIAAINGRENLAADIYDAQATLEMINGVYLSALEHRSLDFPLKNRLNPLRCD